MRAAVSYAPPVRLPAPPSLNPRPPSLTHSERPEAGGHGQSTNKYAPGWSMRVVQRLAGTIDVVSRSGRTTRPSPRSPSIMNTTLILVMGIFLPTTASAQTLGGSQSLPGNFRPPRPPRSAGRRHVRAPHHRRLRLRHPTGPPRRRRHGGAARRRVVRGGLRWGLGVILVRQARPITILTRPPLASLAHPVATQRRSAMPMNASAGADSPQRLPRHVL